MGEPVDIEATATSPILTNVAEIGDGREDFMKTSSSSPSPLHHLLPTTGRPSSSSLSLTSPSSLSTLRYGLKSNPSSSGSLEYSEEGRDGRAATTVSQQPHSRNGRSKSESFKSFRSKSNSDKLHFDMRQGVFMWPIGLQMLTLVKFRKNLDARNKTKSHQRDRNNNRQRRKRRHFRLGGGGAGRSGRRGMFGEELESTGYYDIYEDHDDEDSDQQQHYVNPPFLVRLSKVYYGVDGRFRSSNVGEKTKPLPGVVDTTFITGMVSNDAMGRQTTTDVNKININPNIENQEVHEESKDDFGTKTSRQPSKQTTRTTLQINQSSTPRALPPLPGQTLFDVTQEQLLDFAENEVKYLSSSLNCLLLGQVGSDPCGGDEEMMIHKVDGAAQQLFSLLSSALLEDSAKNAQQFSNFSEEDEKNLFPQHLFLVQLNLSEFGESDEGTLSEFAAFQEFQDSNTSGTRNNSTGTRNDSNTKGTLHKNFGTGLFCTWTTVIPLLFSLLHYRTMTRTALLCVLDEARKRELEMEESRRELLLMRKEEKRQRMYLLKKKELEEEEQKRRKKEEEEEKANRASRAVSFFDWFSGRRDSGNTTTGATTTSDAGGRTGKKMIDSEKGVQNVVAMAKGQETGGQNTRGQESDRQFGNKDETFAGSDRPTENGKHLGGRSAFTSLSTDNETSSSSSFGSHNSGNTTIAEVASGNKVPESEKSQSSTGDLSLSSSGRASSSSSSSSLPIGSPSSTTKYYRKSMRPSSEELRKLQLKPGRNSIRFYVNTAKGTRATLSARMYLWNVDSRIVVSDIDGTITKSDILGHILPRFTSDNFWAHSGVAKLYSGIKRNGYQILYLSSRNIGLSDATKEYLENLTEDERKQIAGGSLHAPKKRVTRFKSDKKNKVRAKTGENMNKGRRETDQKGAAIGGVTSSLSVGGNQRVLTTKNNTSTNGISNKSSTTDVNGVHKGATSTTITNNDNNNADDDDDDMVSEEKLTDDDDTQQHVVEDFSIASLPDGPVFLSPDRLFESVAREVIYRKPQVFKMACLRDIQMIFQSAKPKASAEKKSKTSTRQRSSSSSLRQARGRTRSHSDDGTTSVAVGGSTGGGGGTRSPTGSPPGTRSPDSIGKNHSLSVTRRSRSVSPLGVGTVYNDPLNAALSPPHRPGSVSPTGSLSPDESDHNTTGVDVADDDLSLIGSVAERRRLIKRRERRRRRELRKRLRSQTPFFAGFGNRDSDVMSYKHVGVSTSRIFFINPEGEIRPASNSHYVVNHDEMMHHLDTLFPQYWDGINLNPNTLKFQRTRTRSMSNFANKKKSAKKKSTSSAKAPSTALELLENQKDNHQESNHKTEERKTNLSEKETNQSGPSHKNDVSDNREGTTQLEQRNDTTIPPTSIKTTMVEDTNLGKNVEKTMNKSEEIFIKNAESQSSSKNSPLQSSNPNSENRTEINSGGGEEANVLTAVTTSHSGIQNIDDSGGEKSETIHQVLDNDVVLKEEEEGSAEKSRQQEEGRSVVSSESSMKEKNCLPQKDLDKDHQGNEVGEGNLNTRTDLANVLDGIEDSAKTSHGHQNHEQHQNSSHENEHSKEERKAKDLVEDNSVIDNSSSNGGVVDPNSDAAKQEENQQHESTYERARRMDSHQNTSSEHPRRKLHSSGFDVLSAEERNNRSGVRFGINNTTDTAFNSINFFAVPLKRLDEKKRDEERHQRRMIKRREREQNRKNSMNNHLLDYDSDEDFDDDDDDDEELVDQEYKFDALEGQVFEET
eukprot:g2021.t1